MVMVVVVGEWIGNFHEWFILGSIAHIMPRMGQAQHLEIILESMSDNDFVVHELSNCHLSNVEGDGMFRGEILFGNTRHEGSVVGNLLFDADHGVVENITIPIDECDPCKAGVGSTGSDSDHFGIEGNVS